MNGAPSMNTNKTHAMPSQLLSYYEAIEKASQDMLDAARAIEQGLWHPQPLDAEAAPQRFGFVRDPQPAVAAQA